MLDSFFGDGAWVFAVPALLGTAVFVLQLVFMSMGAADLDLGLDLDVDPSHGDPGTAFQVLSLQSIASFAMGFGWGGLGAMLGFEWGWPASLLMGVLAGVVMVWILALVLKGMHDLQTSGNVKIDAALGAEGDVYIQIPERGQGQGQVRVIIRDRARTYQAVSDGDAIPSRTRVRVVRVNEDNTVTVSVA